MDKTYFLSIVDKDKIDKVYAQLRSPFLPRVGDDILLGMEDYQVLKCSIQMDQIMTATPDTSKIVSIHNPTPQLNPELVIPVIIVANIIKIEEKSESK